jgi:hypothetical protein
MIFGALNQGRLWPGHCLTNPICPYSTFSQAAAPQRTPARATQRSESLATSSRPRQYGIHSGNDHGLA